MWTLAIDTSSQRTSLALRNSKGQILESFGTGGEELPGLVRKLLSEASVYPQELSGLVVGSGPGSFTGLRIGFGFMKGLAQALCVPLRTINSLQAMAFESIPDNGGRAAAIAYAGREEYFSAAFEFNQRTGKQLVSLAIRKLDEFLGALEAGMPCAVASGTELMAVHKNSSERAFLQANHVAASLLMLDSANETSFELEEVMKLEPDYLRAVSALTIEDRRSRGMLKN